MPVKSGPLAVTNGLKPAGASGWNPNLGIVMWQQAVRGSRQPSSREGLLLSVSVVKVVEGHEPSLCNGAGGAAERAGVVEGGAGAGGLRRRGDASCCVLYVYAWWEITRSTLVTCPQPHQVHTYSGPLNLL